MALEIQDNWFYLKKKHFKICSEFLQIKPKIRGFFGITKPVSLVYSFSFETYINNCFYSNLKLSLAKKNKCYSTTTFKLTFPCFTK